jgi:beta-lactamase superfamily II metal-dependent hydrolase
MEPFMELSRSRVPCGVEVLKAQNLHASHHGSRTFVKDAKDDPEPYLEAFELIDSEDVIISVGPDSKHDHPHEDMLDIYNDQVGAENVLQTCVEGVCAKRILLFTRPRAPFLSI